MKKYFLYLSICLLLVVGMSSCKSKGVPFQPTTETNRTVTITETVHDTVFKIEKDNSHYQALLECQNGKIVIKSKVEKQSKNGKLEPPSVKIEDNKIYVDCNIKEQELYAKWKLKHRSELNEIINKIPVLVERDFTTFQVIQIWCGRFFLSVIFGLIVYGILKFKKII